jgi:CMP/dCMP kinase
MASPIIAIDGPAGSGKSTLSRALCERLGLDRLDTGAMYRSVAWAALDRGIDPADVEAVGELAETLDLGVGERVTVDGVDVSEAIRQPPVNRTVSVVAANPRVRRAMVERQRRWVAERDGGAVVEGRDIGSVVLPGADVKVYLTATDDERARRRPEEAVADLSRRDHLDRTRAISPLGVAEGAHVIDTTGRSVDEITDEIVGWL